MSKRERSSPSQRVAEDEARASVEARLVQYNKKGELAGYWKTLAEDFHWHIEILPITEKRSKSYSIKEVYFNAVLPEQAAEQLRALDPNS